MNGAPGLLLGADGLRLFPYGEEAEGAGDHGGAGALAGLGGGCGAEVGGGGEDVAGGGGEGEGAGAALGGHGLLDGEVCWRGFFDDGEGAVALGAVDLLRGGVEGGSVAAYADG